MGVEVGVEVEVAAGVKEAQWQHPQGSPLCHDLIRVGVVVMVEAPLLEPLMVEALMVVEPLMVEPPTV